MLLSLWPRGHYKGAIAGCAAGLVAIFLCGCGVKRSFVGGFQWFLLPEGLYSHNSMITFVVALLVPIIVAITVSLSLPPMELPPMPTVLPTQDQDLEEHGQETSSHSRGSSSSPLQSPGSRNGVLGFAPLLTPPVPAFTPSAPLLPSPTAPPVENPRVVLGPPMLR